MNKRKFLAIISIVFTGIFLLIGLLAGQTWDPSKRLTWNSGDSFRPAIAVDSENNIHVIWHDDSAGNTEIYHRGSTDGGISWTTKRLTWNSFASEMPSLGIDSSKNIYVV